MAGASKRTNADEQRSIPRLPTGLLALAVVLTAAATVWLARKVYGSNRFVEELKPRQIEPGRQTG